MSDIRYMSPEAIREMKCRECGHEFRIQSKLKCLLEVGDDICGCPKFVYPTDITGIDNPA